MAERAPSPVRGAARFTVLTVTAWIAILVGAACFAFWEFEAERNQRLAYIDRQISELYGPLSALNDEKTKVQYNFDQTRGLDFPIRDDGTWDPKSAPTVDQISEWRTADVKIFWPIYDRMKTVVLGHTELIIGGRTPSSFTDLIAFVDERRLDEDKWVGKDGALLPVTKIDMRANTLTATPPVHFENCVFEGYKQLTDIRDRMRVNVFLILAPKPSASEGCRQ